MSVWACHVIWIRHSGNYVPVVKALGRVGGVSCAYIRMMMLSAIRKE